MQRRINSTDIAVAARMRLRRKEMRLSQADIAKKLGITFQQVQKYEKGTNRMGAGRLEAVAKVLEVPVSYFFEAAELQPDGAPPALTLLAAPGAFELLSAYNSIESRETRRAVLDLARALARAEPRSKDESS